MWERGDPDRRTAVLSWSLTFAVVAAALTLYVRPIVAQTLCTEPIEPSCLEIGETYAEEEDERRCRQDIETFIEEAKAFEQCLARSIEQTRKMRQAVEARFDCKQRGQTPCPGVPEL